MICGERHKELTSTWSSSSWSSWCWWSWSSWTSVPWRNLRGLKRLLSTLPVAPMVSGFGLTAYAGVVAAATAIARITAPLLLQQLQLQFAALEELPSSAFWLRRMFIIFACSQESRINYEPATFTGTVQISTVASSHLLGNNRVAPVLSFLAGQTVISFIIFLRKTISQKNEVDSH